MTSYLQIGSFGGLWRIAYAPPLASVDTGLTGARGRGLGLGEKLVEVAAQNPQALLQRDLVARSLSHHRPAGR